MKARHLAILVVIVLLSCAIPGSFPLRADPAGKADKKATLQSFLTQSFDLKPRFTKGAKRYYRLVIVYKTLDSLGRVISRSEHSGNFERVVESVDASGKAYERITWRNAAIRNSPGAKDPYGPYKKLEWMEGFSYRFSAEDTHEQLSLDLSKFPRTMEGYQSYLLVIDAHFEFDYLRSSYHGAIEKLKRIGDEVEAPDSHIPFRLDYPPLIPNSDLKKKDVFIKFVGLTQVGGEPCAVISHRQGPGDFYLDFAMGTPAPVRTEITSIFAGDLIVRLSDGSLVHGDFIEHVRSKLQPPGQANPMSGQARADYVIDEIPREEYERAGLLEGAPKTPKAKDQ